MAFDKVVDSSELDAGLTAIANAIREKGGTSETLVFPDGMADAIAAIDTENAFEITPAETGVILIEDIVPFNVYAAVCVRANGRADEAPDGTGEKNTDFGETPFCASLVIEYGAKGTQNLVYIYNNTSGSYYSGKNYFDNYSINNATPANGYTPFVIAYNPNAYATGGRLRLYVGEPGARGLRVGATYKIYFMTHEEES